MGVGLGGTPEKSGAFGGGFGDMLLNEERPQKGDKWKRGEVSGVGSHNGAKGTCGGQGDRSPEVYKVLHLRKPALLLPAASPRAG